MGMGELQRQIDALSKEIAYIKENVDKTALRHEPAEMGQPKGISWAVCKENAPDDRRYVYANMIDDEGAEITEGDGANIKVYFNIFGATDHMLNVCVPELKASTVDMADATILAICKRPVNNAGKIEKRWYCLYPVNKGRECDCIDF